MRKLNFSEPVIVGSLQEAESAVPVADLLPRPFSAGQSFLAVST
jgi:hypothetical protein